MKGSGAPRDLRVRLLGQVEFILEGQPFALATPRKSLQVLSYLLLHRGAPVSRDFLAFTLWPDEEEDVARSRLRSTLNDLLKVLPQPAADFVVAESESLRWNPSVALRLDVDEFEEAASDPARLAEAAELYRGDLLPELYDEWISAERERRREVYLAVLLELGADLRRRGKRTRAVDVAHKVLSIDPWREDVVRRIMTLRYEMGDRAGALAEYADFARRLHAEMGVEPMLETQTLAERLQRGDLEEEHADSEAVLRVRPRDDERFVFAGRTRELERLSDLWNLARRRRGGTLFVGGEAGIGKSRLVSEFVRFVEDDGGRVLFGATGAPESFPYQSLVESLRSGLPLVAALELGGIWFAALASMLPELAQRLGPLPPLPMVDAKQQSLRLYEALSRTLISLAKPRPLLVVLEDVHWASEATLDALVFLTRRIAGAPILLVATFRAEEARASHPLRRILRDADLQGEATTLTLEPLDRNSVAEIVASDSPGRDSEHLYHRSNGNPLFLAQLLFAPEESDGNVPTTIASLVVARAQTLSESARAVAEIAALAGQRFSADIVREVAGWNDGEISLAVDELLERRFVREAAGRGIFRYAFAHQLVQQAIFDLSDPGRLRDRSRRMARALLSLYPERADELAAEIARHFETGGLAEDAAAHYAVAARRALDLGALEDARQATARGLALGPPTSLTRGLLLIQRSVYERSGDAAAELDAMDRLSKLADETSDDDLSCSVLMMRSRLAVRRGDLSAADFLAQLRARAAEMGSVLWAARADFAESQLIEFGLALDRGIELLRRALAGFRSCGDLGWTASALGSLGRALVMRGDVAEGRRELAEALKLVEGPFSYDTRRGVLRLATASAQDAGDIEGAAALGSKWLEACVAAGDRREEILALSATAWALAMTPNFSRALPVLESAAEIAEDLALEFDRAMIGGNSAEILLKLGAFATAIPLLEHTFGLFASVKPLHAGGPAAMLSLALTYAGDPERAVSVAREALPYLEDSGNQIDRSSALESLGEAQWRCGDVNAAIVSLGAALELRRATHVASAAANDVALLAALHAQAHNQDAARDFLTAFDEFKGSAEVGALWPQRTAWAAAFAYHQCGDATAATRWLETSLRLSEQYAGFLEGEQKAAFEALPWHRAAKSAGTGIWPAAVW